MGITHVKIKVKKDRKSKRFVEEDFLVDSGVAYTVVPVPVLKRLGIEADEEHSFFLANGEKITRKVGEAYFVLGQSSGTAKVIFGKKGDSNLLGALTLEALGLILDPLKRKLKPMPMLLM